MKFSDIYKKGYGKPNVTDIIEGGLAIDIRGKKAYSKDEQNKVFQIGMNADEVLELIKGSRGMEVIPPIGSIVMYSGQLSDVPFNWVLCNGLSGTPDLINKFVMGTNVQSEIRKTGGTADAIVVSHKHTTPSHGHTTVAHNHNASSSSGSIAPHSHSTKNHSHSATQSAHYHAGSTQSHNHYVDIPASDRIGNPGGGAWGFIIGPQAGHHPTMRVNVSTAGALTTKTHPVQPSIRVSSSAVAVNAASVASSGGSTSLGGTTVKVNNGAVTVNTTGVSGKNKNIPPYVKLAYIMRKS